MHTYLPNKYNALKDCFDFGLVLFRSLQYLHMGLDNILVQHKNKQCSSDN